MSVRNGAYSAGAVRAQRPNCFAIPIRASARSMIRFCTRWKTKPRSLAYRHPTYAGGLSLPLSACSMSSG